MATLAALDPAVNSIFSVIPTAAEVEFGHQFAWEADGGDRNDYPGPEWSADIYEPTSEDDAANVEATLGVEAERDAILAAYFRQLDWDREYALEQRDIDRHNREVMGYEVYV